MLLGSTRRPRLNLPSSSAVQVEAGLPRDTGRPASSGGSSNEGLSSGVRRKKRSGIVSVEPFDDHS